MMIFRSFRSEWVKLRRRTLLAGTYVALVVIAGFFTVLVFARAGHPARGDRDRFVSLAELARPHGLALGLSRGAVLLGIVAFGIAAAQMAGEFNLGTIRQLLVRQPRRSTLIVGKHFAVLTFLAGALVLALVSAGVSAIAMAHVRHISTSAWSSSTGLGDLARTFANLSLATAGYATLGILVGLVLRSAVLSVMVALVYLLIFENVLSSIVSGAGRWLPGQLLNTVASGGDNATHFSTALITIVIYLGIAAAAGLAMFTRSDVTV